MSIEMGKIKSESQLNGQQSQTRTTNSSEQRQLWRQDERKRWTIALFLGSTILYASRLIIPVISVDISKDFKWNKKSTGAIMGSFFWGYMITQFLGGYFSDIYGGERVVTMAAFGWALVNLAFPYLPSFSNDSQTIYYLFIALRVVQGLCQGFHYPGIGSLMSKRVNSDVRQSTYCYISSGSHAGTLLIGFTGSLLLSLYGWKSTFYVIGAFCFIWTVVTRRLLLFDAKGVTAGSATLPTLTSSQLLSSTSTSSSTTEVASIQSPSPSYHHHHSNISAISSSSNAAFSNKASIIISPACLSSSPSSPRLNGGESSPSKRIKPSISVSTSKAPNSSKMCESFLKIPWKNIIKSKQFWAMLFAHFTHTNAMFILISWLPSYFHDNFPDAKNWVFNVVPWLITIPVVLISGLMADRMITKGYSINFVRKFMTTFVLLICGLLLISLGSIQNYYWALSCMAASVACCGFHSAGIMLNPADLAPTYSGALYGIMTTIGAIPGFAGVYLVGYLLDLTKDWALVFELTGGFCVMGWAVYALFGGAQKIV